MYLPQPSYDIDWYRKLRQLKNRLGIFYTWITAPRVKYPFFILCEARTGSTLLSDYIISGSQGLVSLGDEVLNPLTTPGIGINASLNQSIKHLEYSLNALKHEKCGVKLHFKHCEWHNLNVEHLIKNFPTAQFIILYRKNIIRQFCSEKIAAATLAYDSRSKTLSPGKKATKINLCREEFISYTGWLLSHYEYTLNQPDIENRSVLISYEELTSDTEKVLKQKIFPLLGINAGPYETTLQKQNDRALSKIISNFEAVKDLVPIYSEVKLNYHQTKENWLARK